MMARYGSSAIFGGFVTFGLFFVMQLLVASGNANLQEDPFGKFVDVIQVKPEQEVTRKDREVEKPPEVETPPEIDLQQQLSLDASGPGLNFDNVSLDADVGINSGIGGVTDGEYLPIVKVNPVYPRRAAERGISGYVLLEFTVTALGTVEDPVVIEADPKGYFERAAMNAARKFKYKPKVVNGEPVAVAGVRNLISFELEEEGRR